MIVIEESVRAERPSLVLPEVTVLPGATESHSSGENALLASHSYVYLILLARGAARLAPVPWQLQLAVL